MMATEAELKEVAVNSGLRGMWACKVLDSMCQPEMLGAALIVHLLKAEQRWILFNGAEMTFL